MLGGVSTDTLPIDYCCVHHGLHGGGAAGRTNANTTYLTTADRPRKRTYVRTYMLSRTRLSDTHSLFYFLYTHPKKRTYLLLGHPLERRHLPPQVPALGPPEPFQAGPHEVHSVQPRQRLRGALVDRGPLGRAQAGKGGVGEDAPC